MSRDPDRWLNQHRDERRYVAEPSDDEDPAEVVYLGEELAEGSDDYEAEPGQSAIDFEKPPSERSDNMVDLTDFRDGDVGEEPPEPSATKFMSYTALTLIGAISSGTTLYAAFNGWVVLVFLAAATFGLTALVFVIQVWQAMLLGDPNIGDPKHPKE